MVCKDTGEASVAGSAAVPATQRSVVRRAGVELGVRVHGHVQSVVADVEIHLVRLLAFTRHDTTHDTRCYYNVRSIADTSQLNLPRGTNN